MSRDSFRLRPQLSSRCTSGDRNSEFDQSLQVCEFCVDVGLCVAVAIDTSLYELLGVHPEATEGELSRAWRNCVDSPRRYSKTLQPTDIGVSDEIKKAYRKVCSFLKSFPFFLSNQGLFVFCYSSPFNSILTRTAPLERMRHSKVCLL